MTCFSMDPIEYKCALFLSYLELHKGLGRSKADTTLVRKYKMSASKELSWELCHVFKILSKKYLQMDCGSMNKYHSMHRSDFQQPKTRR